MKNNLKSAIVRREDIEKTCAESEHVFKRKKLEMSRLENVTDDKKRIKLKEERIREEIDALKAEQKRVNAEVKQQTGLLEKAQQTTSTSLKEKEQLKT